MAKKQCMTDGCSSVESITDYNYAGFIVQTKGNYPFPDRIQPISLPGHKKQHFLCQRCANETKVKCSVHGTIFDSQFRLGSPPECKKCKEEAELLKKGILPKGFDWMVPLTSRQIMLRNVLNEGCLAASNDQKVHVIDKKGRSLLALNNIYSEAKIDSSHTLGDETVLFEILTKNGKTPLFIIKTASEKLLLEIDLNETAILEKARGPWFGLWRKQIEGVLKPSQPDNPVWLVSIERRSIAEGSFSVDSKNCPAALCTIDNDETLTFPGSRLPSLKYVDSWHNVSLEGAKGIDLQYKTDGIPQNVSFRDLYSYGSTGFLDHLREVLNSISTSEGAKSYDLSNAGIFEAIIHPAREKQRMLVKIKGKEIFLTPLPEGEGLSFSKGFLYQNRLLLIPNQLGHNPIELYIKDEELFSRGKLLSAPNKMYENEDDMWGIYFDKNNPTIHTLWVGADNFSVNGGNGINYYAIEELAVNELDDQFCEVILRWSEDKGSKTLNLVAPESLAYDTQKVFAGKRVSTDVVTLTTQELYEEYNSLKKNNILFDLFSDIALLNRKLDEGESINDLCNKLNRIDAESFFKDNELRDSTLQKITLLSYFLPKIKQQFVIVSSYYPHYQVKKETEFLSAAFGKDVADRVVLKERKRIATSFRRNIQTTQAKIQRAFIEIEKSIRPVEEALAKDKIHKAFHSKITRNLPVAAQVIMVGAILGIGGAATSGVGILAGMLGINVFRDVLNLFQKDRIDAAQLKRSSETVFSWWQVFMETMPIIMFEAGEIIDEDIVTCEKRDKEILINLPKSRQSKALGTLNSTLRSLIEEGSQKRFGEVLKNSRITVGSILTDLESTIQLETPKNVDNFIDTLPLTKA